MLDNNKHPLHELAIMCKVHNESANKASEYDIITVVNSIKKREYSPGFVTLNCLMNFSYIGARWVDE